jgi:hypothetical protein
LKFILFRTNFYREGRRGNSTYHTERLNVHLHRANANHGTPPPPSHKRESEVTSVRPQNPRTVCPNGTGSPARGPRHPAAYHPPPPPLANTREGTRHPPLTTTTSLANTREGYVSPTTHHHHLLQANARGMHHK